MSNTIPTPQERLAALRQHTGMSLKKMSEEAGIKTAQTLYEIKNGKHSFSSEVAKKLHERWPELSRGWLMSGEGEMLLNAVSSPQVKQGDYVPLMPVSAFAGPIKSFLSESVELRDCESILSPSPGAELAIPVCGDSMEPMLHDGTIIFIKKINDRAFIPWGQTMVIDTENGAFVKDIFPGDSENIIARSKNPRYPDMHIPHSSIYGIYRVVNAIRSFGVM
ncbi:MAG: helix-turn-helix transcriptional regulator [Bacteroidales bacterium]|nr:helix-turn-helix transcriptional regulator [Bacteroidales bacterium]